MPLPLNFLAAALIAKDKAHAMLKYCMFSPQSYLRLCGLVDKVFAPQAEGLWV